MKTFGLEYELMSYGVFVEELTEWDFSEFSAATEVRLKGWVEGAPAEEMLAAAEQINWTEMNSYLMKVDDAVVAMDDQTGMERSNTGNAQDCHHKPGDECEVPL